MLEGQRYFRALRRATFLLRPWFWAQVLLVAFLMNLLVEILQGVLTLPLLIPLMFSNPQALQGEVFSPWMVVMGLISGLTGAATFPLMMGVFVLQYYDTRVRKEGYDLQLLAQELGASLPPTPGEEAGVPVSGASADEQTPPAPSLPSDTAEAPETDAHAAD